MTKKTIKISLILGIGISLLSWGITAQSASLKEVPVKGTINLVDFWSDYCLPCKMMAPVLAKVEKNYQGKVAIVHVDIEKFPDQVKRFSIRVIPTQVFFDQKGKEVFRHEGFMSEKEIAAQFKKMGVD
ncbi:MAG: thioredoxin fold domain-containing protein [Deltaproteobacteria bacterium]|nr:thioredoxin fold domain-containing protein [Deltaproteobacteria bacterium]